MLQLYRGVHPIVLMPDEEEKVSSDPGGETKRSHRPIADPCPGLSSHALEVERAVALGYCKPGDTVIIVAADHGSGRSVLGEAISMRVAQVLRTNL